MTNLPTSPDQVDLKLFGNDHVRVYRETGGARGYDWNGSEILLLTTTGRRSGEERTIPLCFARDGGNLVIVASKGGAPTHPAWYLNLQADANATVQVKDKVFKVTARTARSPERERLWPIALTAWPLYDSYQHMTDREIPVVVLEPTAG